MTIADIRRAKGWSLRELARRADLSAGRLSDVETEPAPTISVATLGKLAKAFNMPRHTLLAVLDGQAELPKAA